MAFQPDFTVTAKLLRELERIAELRACVASATIQVLAPVNRAAVRSGSSITNRISPSEMSAEPKNEIGETVESSWRSTVGISCVNDTCF